MCFGFRDWVAGSLLSQPPVGEGEVIVCDIPLASVRLSSNSISENALWTIVGDNCWYYLL